MAVNAAIIMRSTATAPETRASATKRYSLRPSTQLLLLSPVRSSPPALPSLTATPEKTPSRA
ncbi:hypothetical protein SDRG_03800 [Saprolegnia diclina VS20]|uniref:Uncharacterized protein n=1 Tax=Saprolegnia diclina (strain VS20) TaxID=1156394 RepID=T0S7U2_SAPDV|nr:hypothetical protein SDRG_03800 [Saprolegnia diclina VS20]EQC38842.1 hypothetical protein SDRG_03800 [Saprolegnia diclina VS20]|eukprot:XP_008607666.1 hypothetical protein SDRG_03800 [Saprolegnia diclina VS20]